MRSKVLNYVIAKLTKLAAAIRATLFRWRIRDDFALEVIRKGFGHVKLVLDRPVRRKQLGKFLGGLILTPVLRA